MVDQEPASIESENLPVDRVDRVGEYFKSLFVRSLRLGLDDGAREPPRAAPAPSGEADPPVTDNKWAGKPV